MSKFFDDTMQGLLEAVAIEKGTIPLVEVENMPASTFRVDNKDEKLIDQIIALRKENHISQTELAAMTGNRQQAISRFEKKENNPSLKLFNTIVNALGYELRIVKKEA